MRTALSVLSGIIVGAAGVVFLGPEKLQQRTPSTTEITDSGSGPSRITQRVDEDHLVQVLAENGTLQRTTVYEFAVQSDGRELRSIIEELAAGPASGMQRFALSVLFARYAELDAAGSIDALSRVRDLQLAEALALEILDVIGIDDFNITWVTGSLPSSESMRFRVEAIARLAESSPSAALQLALLTD
ncbi:MAG TPA: hypothetical protein VKQ06_14360, partial [Gammaproteobacteria bacterium]|nr:hypothetical protein [Gammaproteobacteria bacterium]